MIIALDPGGSTGIAASWYGYTTRVLDGDISHESFMRWHFNARTLGPKPHHGELFDYLLQADPASDIRPTVVCESFEYRNRERPGLVLDSVEYIGIVKLLCTRYDYPLKFYTAGAAKSFVKDHNLKRLGLYQKGEQYKHERDAYRHLLFYMVHELKDTEVLRQGWKA